jgi:site-specific DNA-methyltransferase (adenine-specific)
MNARTLFGVEPAPVIMTSGSAAVGFWRTPSWLADALVERAAPISGDVVCEPTCGDGAILAAVPADVQAFGIEIDPILAAEAVRVTGRTIIVGDALTVTLPAQPTLVIGNPPFSQTFVERLLGRFHRELHEGGRMVLLLSVHLFQTSATVARYAELFSLAVELVPRDVFPGLERPLLLATLTKAAERRIVGIAFAREIAELRGFPAAYRALLERSKSNVWVRVCEAALREIGRPATVDEIASIVQGVRPTTTTFWREAIRKHLRESFVRVAPATYALPEAA